MIVACLSVFHVYCPFSVMFSRCRGYGGGVSGQGTRLEHIYGECVSHSQTLFYGCCFLLAIYGLIVAWFSMTKVYYSVACIINQVMAEIRPRWIWNAT